jgi:hypothetical protein
LARQNLLAASARRLCRAGSEVDQPNAYRSAKLDLTEAQLTSGGQGASVKPVPAPHRQSPLGPQPV